MSCTKATCWYRLTDLFTYLTGSILGRAVANECCDVIESKQKSKFLPSQFLLNRAAPISVSLAFGAHSCTSTVNATVGGWPTGRTVCLASMLFPEVQNAKQGNSMFHFSSL